MSKGWIHFCAAVCASVSAAWLAAPIAGATTPVPAEATSPQTATQPPAQWVSPQDLAWLRVLPPWPATGTAQASADLAQVLLAQTRRDPQAMADAQTDARRDGVAWASDGRALGPTFAASAFDATHQLLNALGQDMRAINRAANAVYPYRPRPAQASAHVQPALALGMASSAYPSARTASTWVFAQALSALAPECAARLLAHAERSARWRFEAGLHYPSDLVGGRAVGAAAWAAAHARLRRASVWQRAESEWRTPQGAALRRACLAQ